ncbi:hypothetical protein C6499_21995 [Candidatus Poribacteria bacterium]|nr:MAG: hypothetical protein C6499_21995 [Candidatus Poribacteria bacterium]
MKTFNNKITLNLDEDAEVFVTGFIEPIAYTGSNFHKRWSALANLQVAEPEKRYPPSVFHAFLPGGFVSVGECWEIEKKGVLALLQQLSPNPSLDMRNDGGDSCGLWACLRAYNDQFADIMFRIHAEFAIQDGWFTPSQLAGHLVIDRRQEIVEFFQLRVPEGILNFDVNWETTEDGWDPGIVITDAGYCPQMELHSGTQKGVQALKFTETITQEEAAHKLACCFYKSQQINWVSLENALEMAQAQQKPIHAISISGTLADEAC